MHNMCIMTIPRLKKITTTLITIFLKEAKYS